MTTPTTGRLGPTGPDRPERSTDGHVEIRIVAGDPDAARQVALLLSRFFVSDEPRSYPDGEGGGTRLHLTVNTRLSRATGPSANSWLAASRSQAQRAHLGEAVAPRPVRTPPVVVREPRPPSLGSRQP